VVECACGTQVDDGHLMIECESCKAWAHTACLQAQMVSSAALQLLVRTLCLLYLLHEGKRPLFVAFCGRNACEAHACIMQQAA
jgi:hypothetical protein